MLVPRTIDGLPPGRVDANVEICQAILDDAGFADDLKTSYGRDLYRQLNPG